MACGSPRVRGVTSSCCRPPARSSSSRCSHGTSPPRPARVARTARRCAVAALLLCILQWLLEPAYMAGEVAGILDPSLQQLVLHSRASLVLGMRAAAMACLIPALRAPAPAPACARPPGSCTLVLGSFMFAGHTVTAAPRLLLAPLLGVHVLAASFWLGALWPLHQLAHHMEPVPLAALLADFSRRALVLVPLLALAGIAMACFLLPDVAALATPLRTAAVREGAVVCRPHGPGGAEPPAPHAGPGAGQPQRRARAAPLTGCRIRARGRGADV